MHFSEFSQQLEQLEQTSSRLEMTALLAEIFKKLEPSDVAQATYLLDGRLVPQYQSLEFQMSSKMVMRALARANWPAPDTDSANASESLFGEVDWSDREAVVQKTYKQLGDIGAAAQQLVSARAQEKKSDLSVAAVYEKLVEIAQQSGEGSQERKVQLVVELLNQVSPVSAKYIARIIVGTLRLGFSTMTLLDGLSWTMTESKAESSLLEEAFQKKADIGKLAAAYLAQADQAKRQQVLADYSVEVGVPIVPQLCQVLASSEEVIEKMEAVYAEAKYDGLRVQIHLSKKGIASATVTSPDEKIQVKAFTRNLEDSSHMFPELQDLLKQVLAEEVIFDAEAIGYDPATGELLPFQATITRKRKHDVAKTAESVPLRFFIFDVLAIDGKSLLQEKLRDRKAVLKDVLQPTEQFVITEYLESSDPKELQNFHEEKLAAGLEGVVIKQVDSPYQSGRKGWYWVKMKQAAGTHAKLQDTIDCVVLGYYLGRGKRTEFGLGAFLVGVLKDDETVVTIAKIGTGMSDEQIKDLKQRGEKLAVTDAPKNYTVSKELAPDVWFRPELVAEIAADEVTISPMHSAGVALRFPRLIKLRDDKKWEQATTLEQLKQIAQL